MCRNMKLLFSLNEQCITLNTTYVAGLNFFSCVIVINVPLEQFASFLSGAPKSLGKSVYTGHALLIHELLNFIVPSSSSCNLTFSASPLIHLSLTQSVSLLQSFACLFSRPILLTFLKMSAPFFQIHLCMDFNDLGGMNALAVRVTYHT